MRLFGAFTHQAIQNPILFKTQAAVVCLIEQVRQFTVVGYVDNTSTVGHGPSSSVLYEPQTGSGALLSHEPVHIDDLSRQSALPAPAVASTLMMLELKGSVRQVGVMSFVLAH